MIDCHNLNNNTCIAKLRKILSFFQERKYYLITMLREDTEMRQNTKNIQMVLKIGSNINVWLPELKIFNDLLYLILIYRGRGYA